MLRKFRIKVNSNVYEVVMEELGAAGGSLAAPASNSVAVPDPTTTTTTTPSCAPAATAGGSTPVYAPMPGTVLALEKAVGDTVAAHETVLILEAMKMENEIVAPQAGKITSIQVSSGQQVEASSVLFMIA